MRPAGRHDIAVTPASPLPRFYWRLRGTLRLVGVVLEEVHARGDGRSDTPGARAPRAARAAAGNGSDRISPTVAAGPSVIRINRSARYSASSMSCVTMTTILRSCSHTCSRVSCSSNRVSESSVENGSSSSRNRGWVDSARASDTHCCVPSDSSRRQLIGDVADAHEFEVVRRRPPGACGAWIFARALATASATFVARRQPRQQRRRLKDDGAIGPGLGHLLAVNHHAAQRRPLQPGDDRQHRRLAAARVAENADELAVVDLGVDVLDGDDRALGRLERLAQTRSARAGCGHGFMTRSPIAHATTAAEASGGARRGRHASAGRRRRWRACFTYSVRHSMTCALTRSASSSCCSCAAVRGLGMATATAGPWSRPAPRSSARCDPTAAAPRRRCS